jgi:hypothetical protein
MLDPIDNFFFYLIQVEIEHPIIEGPKYIYIYFVLQIIQKRTKDNNKKKSTKRKKENSISARSETK